MKNQRLKIPGILLFIVCLLLGTGYNFMAFWSDLEGMSFWGYPESTSYDPEIETDGNLHSLICPVLITSSETASVRVRVSNPKDYPIKPNIQVSISNQNEKDQLTRDKKQLLLDPGESVEMSWLVDKDNILFDRVVFVRVFLYQSAYYPPSKTAHCGIYARDLGKLNSTQISSLVTGVSLLGMISGSLFWWWSIGIKTQSVFRKRGIFVWLIALTTLAFISNYLSWMLLAGLWIILIFLSMLAVLEALMLNKV